MTRSRAWNDQRKHASVCRVRAIRRFTVRPVLPAALSALGDLANNLRWSWHPPTQDVFAAVDADLWESTGRDPVKLLGAVGKARLTELAADPAFCELLGAAERDLDAYLSEDRWYQRRVQDGPRAIGYFSPEFGITAVLPQYSGGLGILAGDHLKAASDLGVPIVGVGLLYRHGYFKQALSREGWQQETYPVLDPDGLPISLLREPDGSRATVSIEMPDGPPLVARIWVASVGRVPLLMLDTDVEGNPEHYVDVTDRLYGGNSEHRLRQELLLGVGGVRALRAFSRITGHPDPEVFHTNEGHAGFLGLERIRELTVAEDGPKVDFDTALEMGRASTVFTTHTPVPAGIDRFPRTLVEQYFGEHGATPGVPLERILTLGTEDYTGGDATVFNMAVMGFRLAQRANGVSQAARPRQPRHVQRPVARLRRGRGADRVHHQRCARAVLGGAGDVRPGRRARCRHPLRQRGRVLGRGRQGAGQSTCGRSSASSASGWSSTPAAGWSSRGRNAGRRRPSSSGSTTRSTRTCSPSASPAAPRRTSG